MSLSQLEILYDFNPKNLNLINRKFQISEKKLIICAPKQSGITSVIFMYLNNYKKGTFLYIDFSDLRIDIINIRDNIESFIRKHKIILLIFENFNFSFQIPKCERIIITTNTYIHIDGYSSKQFFPLDFEEYIAFDRKQTGIEQIFNSYANFGTYPQVALSNNTNKTMLIQSILSCILKNKKELEIFKNIVPYQGRRISLYEIFKKIKIKLSKDSFYNIVKYFENTRLLLFVEKYNQPKAFKKLYLIDFTIKDAMSYQKDFIKKFENIIFLELYKKKENIYYTDEIDFYLPKENLAILCLPFIPANLLKNKIIKRKRYFKKLSIKKVEIISLGNEIEFKDDKINYQLIPFWNWANSLN